MLCCAQLCLTLCDPMDCSLPAFSRQEYWSGLPCPPPGFSSIHVPNFSESSLKKFDFQASLDLCKYNTLTLVLSLISVLECVTNESKLPYDFTSSCSNQLFLCNQIRKINTLLLIHFLVLTLTGQYSSIRPLLFLLLLLPPHQQMMSLQGPLLLSSTKIQYLAQVSLMNRQGSIIKISCSHCLLLDDLGQSNSSHWFHHL